MFLVEGVRNDISRCERGWNVQDMFLVEGVRNDISRCERGWNV